MMEEQELVLEEERMMFGVVHINGQGVQTNWFDSKGCAIEFADFLAESDIKVKLIVDKRERV